MDGFLTETELARVLGVGRKTVARLRKAGTLPHVELRARGQVRPLIRYDAAVVKAFFERQLVGGDAPSTPPTMRPRRGRPRRAGSLL